MSSFHSPDHPADPDPQRKDRSELGPIAQRLQTGPLEPGLYVVATPIGNLRDITLRALDILASVDVIYAEDTRQSRKLLDAYGIKKPLRPYHDHNGAVVRPEILRALEEGKAIALVSDAGTPLISDPGYKLVRDVVDQGKRVIPLPGPSAVIAALSAAGLPTDTFVFAGFLPPKKTARQSRLKELSALKGTLVFYETGPRIMEVLGDIITVLGDVDTVIAREITKRFEEFRRGRASALSSDMEDQPPPKGEIVLLIHNEETARETSEADIDAFLVESTNEHGLKEAAARAARQFGGSKRTYYARAQALKDQATKSL